MAKTRSLIAVGLLAAMAALFAQTAQYPTQLVTLQQLKSAKDRAQTTLNAGLNATATSFTVVSGAKFGANVIVTIDNEQISICGVSTNTFSVGHSTCPNIDGRGFGGTSAASHASGALVSAYMTAWNYNAQNAELIAIEAALGTNLGNIVALIPNPTPVANGGTGSTSASAARTALGAAASGSNADITSLTALSTPLPVNEGGTGSTSASAARTALGAAASGSNADITALTGLSTALPITEGGTGAKTALAARSALGVAAAATLSPADYKFAAQTPGGSLSIGSNTITMTPCPLGWSSAFSNYRVYLSGGTGTAESAVVTGGTCTSGATTGTLIVTAANTHSNSWTIQSNSDGLGEALLSLPNGQGIIQIPNTSAAPLMVYGPIAAWPNSGNLTIRGSGSGIDTIARASTFTTGDMFLLDGQSGGVNIPYVTFRSIGIEQGSFTQTGAAIHGLNVAFTGLRLFDTQISNGQYGVRVLNCSLYADAFAVYNSAPAGYKPVAGISVEGTGTTPETTNIYLINTTVTGYPRGDTNQLTYGLYVSGADGIIAHNLALSADYGLYLNPASPDYITNSSFVGLYSDGPTKAGVATRGTGLISRVGVSNFYVNGPISSASSSYVALSLAGTIQEMSFVHGKLAGSQWSAAQIGTSNVPQEVLFDDVFFQDNNLINDAANPHVYLFDGQSGVRITNCRFFNDSAGKNEYGIQIAGALSNSQLTENSFDLLTGAAAAKSIWYNPASTFTNLRIASNHGTEPNTGTITAAATVSLPAAVHDFYVVTGATAVATINGGWTNRVITLQFTNASPGGLTAAGNIYVAKSIVQNATVTLRYDGTKWMVL